MILIVLFAMLVLPTWAEASCSGSGLTWSCTTGTTVAQVNTTLGSATDGATITFDAGTYSWATNIPLSNSKGVTLICATEAACDVTVGAGQLIGLTATAGTNTKLYRVSGFEFLNASTDYTIYFFGSGHTICSNATPCKLTNIRIDHNHFTDYSVGKTAIIFGDSDSVNTHYGVVDHNVMTGATNAQLATHVSKYWDAPPESSYQGTLNAMFYEDNTMTFTTNGNSGSGCIDSLGGSSIVYRRNTTINCLATSHGTIDSGGPWNFELYDNSFTWNFADATWGGGAHLFHHQGAGEFIAYNNVFTPFSGHSGAALAMTHYRSASTAEAGYVGWSRCDGTDVVDGDGNRSPTGTYYGYPCYNQPGRNGLGVLKPMYVWNNYFSDNSAKVPMAIEDNWASGPPYPSTHIVANRDYYNSVSASAQTTSSAPFDGTTGMGFGTVARRPSTCTTGTEAADAGNGGVGYYATDESKLYRCSATNTWTLIYQPYGVHPLVGSVASSGIGRGSKGRGLF